MEKKYKLTEENINYLGRTLYRIEALKDFGNIKKGDKGGFVESEANLSQEGNCWVYDNAKVYSNAKVLDNAAIVDNALVFGNARISNNAVIFGNALVADVAKVYNNARIYGNAEIYGDAQVFGIAIVYSYAKILGNAIVTSHTDYIIFKNWWSSGRIFTWTRSNNMWKVGCFYGAGEELIKKAYEDSELSGREYKRVVDYVESILQDSK